MALTREQLDFIKEVADGAFETGDPVSTSDVVVAGQFLGVDFDCVEEVEALLRELRGAC